MSIDIIDKNMQGVNQAGAELRKSMAPEPLPFETIAGPSAATVNTPSQSQSQLPVTAGSFYARGGLTNTAKNIVNNITRDRQYRESQGKYEQLLAAGERGADNLYNEAIQTYGDQIKNWIPPKIFFYDNDGVFMPHKYAQSVYLGLLKFEENQKKDNEKLAKRAEYQTIAGAIQGAPTQQAAAANVAQLGYNPEEYSKTYSTIPTAKDEASANLDKERISTEEANQKLRAAQADWYRRRKDSTGSGNGTDEKDYHFEQAKKGYQSAVQEKMKVETTLKNLRKQRLDYEKIGMNDQVAQIDSAIAASEAELEVAKNSLQRERAALNTIASTRSNEGRVAEWNAAIKTEVDPAVSRIADLIDENISMNGGNPQYQGAELGDHINGFIEFYMKNEDLDPVLADEVRSELKKRYSSKLNTNKAQNPNTSIIEQKVREIWARKGVNNPTPEQMQNGIASIQRQLGK